MTVPTASRAPRTDRAPGTDCAPGLDRAAPPADRRHAWQTGGLGGDTFYLLVFIAVLLIVVTSTPGSRAVAGGAMGAMIAWYLFVGRPLWAGSGLTQGGVGRRVRANIYLTGLFSLFFVVQSQNPSAWFLAFALSPQFFTVASGRTAVYLSIMLNLTAAALLVWRYPHPSAAAAAIAVGVAGTGFAVFFNGWVSRIIGQSAERAEIIDQLESTRAELANAQHKAGRLAERQRLAADIHDTLAQGFASIVMLVQAAQADLDGSQPQQAARHLDLAARTARENLAEARALVAGLAPAQLDGGTLPDALRRLCEVPGVDPAAVDTTFVMEGPSRPLPMATEVVLLRVCQEGLSNIRKHARAQSAIVRLGYDPDAVRLEVSDDGTGFNPASVSGGFGLGGMRARVAEAGGTLTVDSEPGAGTRVSVMMQSGATGGETA